MTTLKCLIYCSLSLSFTQGDGCGREWRNDWMEKILVERFSLFHHLYRPTRERSFCLFFLLQGFVIPFYCQEMGRGYYIIKLFRNLIISLHSKVYAQTRKITQAEAVQYQYRSGSSSFGLYMMVVRNCNSLLAYFVVRRGKTW
jgi:hypothetical protein